MMSPTNVGAYITTIAYIIIIHIVIGREEDLSFTFIFATRHGSIGTPNSTTDIITARENCYLLSTTEFNLAATSEWF